MIDNSKKELIQILNTLFYDGQLNIKIGSAGRIPEKCVKIAYNKIIELLKKYLKK